MKTLFEWMFLSLIVVGLGMMFFPMVENAIDHQLTMQLNQVEEITNGFEN